MHFVTCIEVHGEHIRAGFYLHLYRAVNLGISFLLPLLIESCQTHPRWSTSNNCHSSSPTGITFDRVANELFVCDQLNHRIQVITRDLQFVRNFVSEGEENGQFKSPMSASFDEGNNLYVTDFGKNRVQVFTAEGQFVTAFSSKAKGEKLQQPYAIAIDSSNIVYVSEWERNSISLFTPEGKLVMPFGESGSEEGQLNQIRGLHVDQHDSIFVSDFKNNRIQIY